MPPEKAEGTVRPERVARKVAEILEEVTKAVDQVVASPHPSPESLHRLHRQMRRLRTGLALWESLLPSAERDLLHPLDVRVKRLSRLVGRIRDRDITLSLLQRFDRGKVRRRDVASVERYRRRVQDDARTGRELLRAFLRSERQARLLDDVSERLRSLPRSGSLHDASQAVTLAEDRTRKNLQRAEKKAFRKPTMQRLHRLRIRIRRARQFSDLAGSLTPRARKNFSSTMVRLQKELGDLHDLDMILVGLDKGVQRTAWAKELRKERRQQRKEILKTLEKTMRGPTARGTVRAG